MNGINPESYLRNVLSRIAEHPVDQIEGSPLESLRGKLRKLVLRRITHPFHLSTRPQADAYA